AVEAEQQVDVARGEGGPEGVEQPAERGLLGLLGLLQGLGTLVVERAEEHVANGLGQVDRQGGADRTRPGQTAEGARSGYDGGERLRHRGIRVTGHTRLGSNLALLRVDVQAHRQLTTVAKE